MKKLLSKFSLLFILISCISLSATYAHSNVKRRNQCNNNGKRYYAIAKVNGPGCEKLKVKDWDCSEVNTALQAVYRYDYFGTPLCGCSSEPTYFLGAEAHSISSADRQYEYAKKTSACNGYRAGGTVSPFPGWKMTSNIYEGNVSNSLSNSTLEFDYQNNQVTLKSLSGFLEIDSEDFENEYSTILVNISQILNPGNFETMVILYSVRFEFENGKFTVKDDKNLFSLSDFKTIKLQHGYRFELGEIDKVISLSLDITPDMTLEVSYTGDVGNQKDENPAGIQNEVSLFEIFPVPVSSNLTLRIETAQDFEGEIKILRNEGTFVQTMGFQYFFIGQNNQTMLDLSGLKPDEYLLTITARNGEILSKRIIKQ